MIIKLLNSYKFTTFKNKLQHLVGFKFSIRRITPSSDVDNRLYTIAKHRGINTIVDIGANEGQFAMAMIQNGFKHKIISFEPSRKTYEKLKKHSSKYGNWITYNSAIGEKDCKLTLNIYKNSLFSSFLKVSGDALNKSGDVVSQDRVSCYTLDSVLNLTSKTLLKIDVQGFEREVLEGCSRNIKYCDVVKIESSINPIYEGNSFSMEEAIEWFKDNGFNLYSVNEVAVNNNTGVVNEVDLIFVRND